ncbi:MAG: 1,4-dihydroxy-2-naphthoate polyprenyltransferase [Ilumatobacteraceae bacterium]
MDAPPSRSDPDPAVARGARRWVLGARPRTLPAAIVPVAVGAACAVGLDGAAADGGPVWWRAPVAGLVSLSLQVGVNYANDYSDGVRGTDDVRVGPTRLVASGLASPSAVKRAALVAFGIAAVAGLALAAVTTWWLLLVGAVSILAGWGYTGGPRPYGYLGLGEVFVFVFFGLVATAGTTFVVAEQLTLLSVIAGSSVGSLACALLVVNNLRDIDNDGAVGKRTLAVRLGDRGTRWLYSGFVGGAFVLVVVAAVWRLPAIIALAALPAALPTVRDVLRGAAGPDLIVVLGATGRLHLVAGLALAVGLAL